MKYLTALFLSVFFCLTVSAEPGGIFPDIETEIPTWIGADRPTGKGAEIEILVFFDVASPDSISFLAMLESLSDKYSENTAKPIKIYAVSTNVVRRTEEFVKENGPFGIPIGADNKRKLYLELASTEPLLPFAIIAEKKRIVWTGFPTDIESVTDRLLKGKFNLSDQIIVTKIRRELQAAVQSSLPDAIIRNADKILEILPADGIAIQAKLFVYSSTGKNKEALKFIQSVVAKNPEELNLRILLLDILLQTGENVLFQEEFRKAVADFKDSQESLFRLLGFALDSAPHGVMPLDTVCLLAKQSLKNFESARPEKKALALEMYARTCSLIGKFDDAIHAQSEAADIRKGSAYEDAAQRLLDYYKTAKRLNAE